MQIRAVIPAGKRAADLWSAASGQRKEKRLFLSEQTTTYDYEYNHIRGEYLAVFDFMNELKVLSNSNPAVSTGAMRYANHNLKL